MNETSAIMVDIANESSDEFAIVDSVFLNIMQEKDSDILKKSTKDDFKNNENVNNFDDSSSNNLQASEYVTEENIQINENDNRHNPQIEINPNKTSSQVQITPTINEDDIAENVEEFADAENSVQQELEVTSFKDLVMDYKYIFDQLYLFHEKYVKFKIIERKYQNAINKFRKYVTARIDIRNIGNAKNNIEFLDVSDKDASIEVARWLCNDKGNGYKFQSIEETFSIKIKCIENGQLQLRFMGIDYRYEGKRYPIYIKYEKVEINGEKIELGRKIVCHDESFTYSRAVKNNDVINLCIECSIF